MVAVALSAEFLWNNKGRPGEALNEIIIINNCCLLTESYRVGEERLLDNKQNNHQPSQVRSGQVRSGQVRSLQELGN